MYGTVAGIMFGLSSALTKPTLDYLHESVGTMLSHWECYALAIAGAGGARLARGRRRGRPRAGARRRRRDLARPRGGAGSGTRSGRGGRLGRHGVTAIVVDRLDAAATGDIDYSAAQAPASFATS